VTIRSQQAPKRQFIKDLKAHGLIAGHVILGVMDGLPGLEKVFREEFHPCQGPARQVHVAKTLRHKILDIAQRLL